MKKLLAVAVAATMSATAMADVSISGSANFEYTHNKDKTNNVKTTTNGTDTEITLNVRGKSGDTAVVLDLEFDQAGSAGTANVIDVEDSYITTKLGPVSAKLGNYTSATTGLLGEIEEGGRANDKMTFSYTTNGVKFYAGNSGSAGEDTAINNNMFAGVVATVEGWKLQAKKNNENKSSFGVSGTAGPIGIRVEYANSKRKTGVLTANDGTATATVATQDQDTGYFIGLTAKIDNINLGLTHVAMDGDGGIVESDSSIFAVSNNTIGNSNTQLNANINVDGTTYSTKIGKVGFETANIDDVKYYELSAARTLASGITAKASYVNIDVDANNEESTFEVDLSVKF